MKFTKMHGIGNDFVVVNALAEALTRRSIADISRRLCHRKFGVGGDGLLLVLPSKVADYKMRMFNPDGSEAEMCGNGIRCFAKYIYDRKMASGYASQGGNAGRRQGAETAAPRRQSGSRSRGYGAAPLLRSEIPMRGDDNGRVIGEGLKVEGRKFDITAVSMGNPHVIIFEDHVEEFPVAK